jgi:hypothetical protein
MQLLTPLASAMLCCTPCFAEAPCPGLKEGCDAPVNIELPAIVCNQRISKQQLVSCSIPGCQQEHISVCLHRKAFTLADIAWFKCQEKYDENPAVKCMDYLLFSTC